MGALRPGLCWRHLNHPPWARVRGSGWETSRPRCYAHLLLILDIGHIPSLGPRFPGRRIKQNDTGRELRPACGMSQSQDCSVTFFFFHAQVWSPKETGLERPLYLGDQAGTPVDVPTGDKLSLASRSLPETLPPSAFGFTEV